MNGSFTAHCRAALQTTRAEASRLGHSFVGPEHILLGLLGLTDGIASTALDGLEINRYELRTIAARDLPPPEPTPASGELPYAERSVTVLKNALREARDDGASPVHSGHLLLATVGVEGWPEDLALDLPGLRRGVAEAARISGEPLDF